MKILAKYPIIVIIILTFIFILILDYGVGIENSSVRAGIGSAMAVILAPRKKIIDTQTGKRTQVTWIFLKKPFFLD